MVDLGGQLRMCFRGRVCLIGLGNVDYGDDGFGAVLAETIAGRINSLGEASRRHEIINCGTTPERFIFSASEKGYNHIIFVDAVEFGGAPGSVIFLSSEEMAGRFPQISTHKISIDLMAKCIEAGGRIRAWLLGVQPGSVKLEKGLTKDLLRTRKILEDLICDLFISEAKVFDDMQYMERRHKGSITGEVSIC